jgi:hypothetical protein
MIESIPMTVAGLNPFLSAPVAGPGTARNVYEADGRMPSLMASNTETSNSSLERVDTSPVRSLKPLLKPLPGFKLFSGNESEAMPAALATLAGTGSPVEAALGSAEIAGGFINEFAPFDPAAMDERIQQFLAKLHDQPRASEGGGRFGSLAVLSVAVLGGVIGMQMIRRREPAARKRELSTRSLRLSATKLY